MSKDNTVNFLLENEWEFDGNKRKASHRKHKTGWVGIDEALKLQEQYDPKSTEEFKILNNLNSRHAHMYEEYLDS